MEKWGLSMGPAEISGLLMGYDKFYFTLYDDPRRFSRLLEIVTEFIIAWLKKQEEAFGGIDVFTLADHVPNQVKPEQVKEFFLPCIRAIFATLPQAVKIYHNEGFHSDQHISLLLNYGADVWHFGSDVHDLSSLYSKDRRSDRPLRGDQPPRNHAPRDPGGSPGRNAQGGPGGKGSPDRALYRDGNNPGRDAGKPAGHGPGRPGGIGGITLSCRTCCGEKMDAGTRFQLTAKWGGEGGRWDPDLRTPILIPPRNC